MHQAEFVGQDLNLSASLHREIARSPMATAEKINGNPLNSDYEEKLLLDELMSTPHSDERMYIPYSHTFTCVHEKTYYDNMCKTASGASCENNKKCFRQKLMIKNEVKGGKSHVY
jgi:hypothetical protein